MLPANRRILDKLHGVRFPFIVQVIEKVQNKAQFSVCGQRKAFLRGIQPSSVFTAERLPNGLF